MVGPYLEATTQRGETIRYAPGDPIPWATRRFPRRDGALLVERNNVAEWWLVLHWRADACVTIAAFRRQEDAVRVAEALSAAEYAW